MNHRFRYPYGVGKVEVEAWIEANQCVKDFLSKYRKSEESKFLSARALCMFFKWLPLRNRVCVKCGGTWSHVVDDCPSCNSPLEPLVLSPSEFLNVLLKKRSSVKVEDRHWGRKLALTFSRDNPDFENLLDTYVRGKYFEPLKLFCDYHEVPLTSARAVFGPCSPRKYEEKPLTVARAKQILSLLNQRDRALCMTMLQSGQSIRQVLQNVNGMADYIFSEIDQGKNRIRLDFPERKGNHFKYFSFISQDAIQEIAKWRVEREKRLEKHGLGSKWLFITRKCKPLTPHQFQRNFKDLMRNHGFWTGPYTVRSHQFRQMFETEASPPDRGISKLHVMFMMGHANGKQLINKLDVVGGAYDRSPWVSKVVENEYAKLEPYINIFSGKTHQLVNEEDMQTLKKILKLVKQGKIRIEP